MAENEPGKIVDAILSSAEFRSSLTRAVEASGSGQKPQTPLYKAVEEEVSAIFRPAGLTATNTRTQTALRASTYPIFHMRKNYTSQGPKR